MDRKSGSLTIGGCLNRLIHRKKKSFDNENENWKFFVKFFNDSKEENNWKEIILKILDNISKKRNKGRNMEIMKKLYEMKKSWVVEFFSSELSKKVSSHTVKYSIVNYLFNVYSNFKLDKGEVKEKGLIQEVSSDERVNEGLGGVNNLPSSVVDGDEHVKYITSTINVLRNDKTVTKENPSGFTRLTMLSSDLLVILFYHLSRQVDSKNQEILWLQLDSFNTLLQEMLVGFKTERQLFFTGLKSFHTYFFGKLSKIRNFRIPKKTDHLDVLKVIDLEEEEKEREMEEKMRSQGKEIGIRILRQLLGMILPFLVFTNRKVIHNVKDENDLIQSYLFQLQEQIRRNEEQPEPEIDRSLFLSDFEDDDGKNQRGEELMEKIIQRKNEKEIQEKEHTLYCLCCLCLILGRIPPKRRKKKISQKNLQILFDTVSNLLKTPRSNKNILKSRKSENVGYQEMERREMDGHIDSLVVYLFKHIIFQLDIIENLSEFMRPFLDMLDKSDQVSQTINVFLAEYIHTYDKSFIYDLFHKLDLSTSSSNSITITTKERRKNQRENALNVLIEITKLMRRDDSFPDQIGDELLKKLEDEEISLRLKIEDLFPYFKPHFILPKLLHPKYIEQHQSIRVKSSVMKSLEKVFSHPLLSQQSSQNHQTIEILKIFIDILLVKDDDDDEEKDMKQQEEEKKTMMRVFSKIVSKEWTKSVPEKVLCDVLEYLMDLVFKFPKNGDYVFLFRTFVHPPSIEEIDQRQNYYKKKLRRNKSFLIQKALDRIIFNNNSSDENVFFELSPLLILQLLPHSLFTCDDDDDNSEFEEILKNVFDQLSSIIFEGSKNYQIQRLSAEIIPKFPHDWVIKFIPLNRVFSEQQQSEEEEGEEEGEENDEKIKKSYGDVMRESLRKGDLLNVKFLIFILCNSVFFHRYEFLNTHLSHVLPSIIEILEIKSYDSIIILDKLKKKIEEEVVVDHSMLEEFSKVQNGCTNFLGIVFKNEIEKRFSSESQQQQQEQKIGNRIEEIDEENGEEKEKERTWIEKFLGYLLDEKMSISLRCGIANSFTICAKVLSEEESVRFSSMVLRNLINFVISSSTSSTTSTTSTTTTKERRITLENCVLKTAILQFFLHLVVHMKGNISSYLHDILTCVVFSLRHSSVMIRKEGLKLFAAVFVSSSDDDDQKLVTEEGELVHMVLKEAQKLSLIDKEREVRVLAEKIINSMTGVK